MKKKAYNNNYMQEIAKNKKTQFIKWKKKNHIWEKKQN